MKIGNTVRLKQNVLKPSSNYRTYSPNFIGTIRDLGNDGVRQWVRFNESDKAVWADEIELIKTEQGAYNMLKAMGKDFGAFVTEHKSTIYMVAVLFLADHLLFQGAFRSRLHEMMNKLLGKVEAQIDGKQSVALVKPETKV